MADLNKVVDLFTEEDEHMNTQNSDNSNDMSVFEDMGIQIDEDNVIVVSDENSTNNESKTEIVHHETKTQSEGVSVFEESKIDDNLAAVANTANKESNTEISNEPDIETQPEIDDSNENNVSIQLSDASLDQSYMEMNAFANDVFGYEQMLESNEKGKKREMIKKFLENLK